MLDISFILKRIVRNNTKYIKDILCMSNGNITRKLICQYDVFSYANKYENF